MSPARCDSKAVLPGVPLIHSKKENTLPDDRERVKNLASRSQPASAFGAPDFSRID
jgi:hypothetical protein